MSVEDAPSRLAPGLGGHRSTSYLGAVATKPNTHLEEVALSPNKGATSSRLTYMGRFIFPQTTRRPKWLLASLGLYILCLFEARGCGGSPEGRGRFQPQVMAVGRAWGQQGRTQHGGSKSRCCGNARHRAYARRGLGGAKYFAPYAYAPRTRPPIGSISDPQAVIGDSNA